jgi:hypothetical protein
MLFEYLEIDYIKNENAIDGQYIDLSQYKLDTTKNYIFTEGAVLVGLYIPNYFKDNVFDEYIKLLNSHLKISNNRGDIAGVIDIDKVYPCFHKHINEKSVYNSTKTRINKDNAECKYAFSNGVKCCKINEKSKYYNEKKKEYNKFNLEIIKPIFNMLKHYIELDTNNEIFTGFNEMIINRSIRSAIHKDSNNADGVSVLFTLGDCKSNIALPDYNISIPLIPYKSLVILPLKRMRHSNDPINEKELQNRLSIVLYNK